MIPKVKVEAVDVPEWGDGFFVRKWNVAQRANVFAAVREAESPAQIAQANIDVVLWSCCDADGRLRFNETDRSALEDADAWVIDRIADKARELNLPEKKSNSNPSESSNSNSPPISA